MEPRFSHTDFSQNHRDTKGDWFGSDPERDFFTEGNEGNEGGLVGICDLRVKTGGSESWRRSHETPLQGFLSDQSFVIFVIFCKRSGACSGLEGDGPIRPTLQSGFCSVVRIGRFGRGRHFGHFGLV